MAASFNEWDVGEDGLLSRQGQSIFPVYSQSGGLARKNVSYYLVDRELGLIKAVEVFTMAVGNQDSGA